MSWVTEIEEWPSRAWISLASAPWRIIREAAVCRSSWISLENLFQTGGFRPLTWGVGSVSPRGVRKVQA
jgi:hypothetical protein